MACIKWSKLYFFWMRCHPIKTSLPKEVWAGTPKSTPSFSPPPNHTPWIPWPMAHLPCIGWVQVNGALALYACSTSSEFVSFWPSHHFCCLCVYLILMYVLVSVYLLWHEGCVGFWDHVPCLSSLSWTGHCLVEGPHLPAEPMFFSFLCLWASWLWILPYHFNVPTIALHLFFFSCYPVGLQADTPAVPTHFFIKLLLRASLANFPHPYLFWALLANIPTMPAHFIISFLGLPRPIYFFFTSFTLMGFLLDPLGFLSPITASLPLITFRAYWPLSQPNEFTDSFLELPWPIYLFFTSFYSCGLAGR